MVDYRKYVLCRREFRDYLIVSYIALFCLAFLFYQNIFLSLLLGGAFVFGKDKYAGYLGNKRRSFLNHQFKDVLYSLSASFAAGHHMEEALEDAVESLNLMYKENSPMALELSYIIKSIKQSRQDEQEALLDFADRSGCEDIREFIGVYITCRSTGGNLEKVIERTSNILSDKIIIEKEIATLTAQKRFEGKLISAMPLGVIFLLNILSPSYLAPLYSSLEGRIIMTVGLFGLCLAYCLTIKITKIEV